MGLNYKDDVEVKNFIKDHNSGMSLEKLAQKYGYTSKQSIYDVRKKLGLSPRVNQWTKDQIDYLKNNYPNESWDVLLKNLSPFRKEDIITKAYKLKIKRECFGYSDEEIQLLKENYGKVKFEEIKNMLPNKTEASIMTKANKLGLTMREKWSDEEIEKLKELYPKYSNEELLDFFPNRTISSLQSNATNLGLYKDIHTLQKHKRMAKEDLLNELIDFAKELGRTPTSEEIQNNKKMPGIITYSRHFGSYREACLEARLVPNVSIYGRSYHYITENGDVCLSSRELEISNILDANEINYKKEIPYKQIIKDDSLPLIRCDWLVNDIIVEYFGMPEKDHYRERMDYKINLCKKNGIKLIDLYPEDLKNNYKGLINKFNRYNINLSIPCKI